MNVRLLPHCVAHGIKSIAEFETFAIVEDFVLSWVNLNPHHNKQGLDAVSVPLAGPSKRAELERFRAFLCYCVDNGWIKTNHTDSKSLKPARAEKGVKKFGMSLTEYERLLEATRVWAKRRWARRNPREIEAMVELSRYSGLRTSDVITFNANNLKQTRNGWILDFIQRKTDEPALVPIPTHVAEILNPLPIKGTREGKRYWFWTSIGKPTTAIKKYQADLTAIITLAQKDGSFAHHTTPHSLRHTFAIQHLIEGVDIYQVSLWLGHTSVETTKKSYAHAIEGIHARAAQVAARSFEGQKQRLEVERRNI